MDEIDVELVEQGGVRRTGTLVFGAWTDLRPDQMVTIPGPVMALRPGVDGGADRSEIAAFEALSISGPGMSMVLRPGG